MSDLIGRIGKAEPRVGANPAARVAALRAAMDGVSGGTPRLWRRRAARVGVVAAVAAAAVTVAVLAVIGAFSGGADQRGRIVLPGDEVPAARPAPVTAARPGIAATIVFRPVAGVTEDQAYARLVSVIEARAGSAKGHSATVQRVERDRALVTLTGRRDPTSLLDVVAGSSVAVYDLDEVLIDTFGSFRKAVLRARSLAPSAPTQVAYLFRNGRLVRGPAPTADDLRRLTKTLPPGSQILEMPAGYAILRRTYADDAKGVARPLRSAQYLLVRDAPAVSPLQVVGAEFPMGRPQGGIAPTPVELTAEGRRAWDSLLVTVSARAASSRRPQRVAVTTNGDIQQLTTADATGHLDTRPGSPALEFGGGISGRSGISLVAQTESAIPLRGSIPAIVWVADTYRVGPSPAVLGDRVPVPERVARSIRSRANGAVDRSSIRRALIVDGPDGQWSVWNYLLESGSLETAVVGPRKDDGFGLTCLRTADIQDCGGSPGFQLFAVPASAHTLRFTPRSGAPREVVADNAWALALGPRRARRDPPATPVLVEAMDENGKVIARDRAPYSLP